MRHLLLPWLVLAFLSGPAHTRPDDLFWSAWEALERAPPGHDAADVRRVVDEAGRLLGARGVRWHAQAGDPDVIVIVPRQGGKSLNDEAWRLARELDGLALVFDARVLKDEDAGALYDEVAHRLVLAPQEIARGRVLDYAAHELVHARNAVRLVRGQDNLYAGWVRRTEVGYDLDPAYPDRFSLDEVQAYAQQAAAQLRAASRGNAEDRRPGQARMADTGAGLAQLVAEVASRAAVHLGEIAALHPLPAATREERITGGRSVTGSVLRTAAGTLRFEPGHAPAWARSPPPVTSAVVVLAGVELEFLVPGRFGREATRADVRRLQQRALQLEACAQAAARAFATVGAHLAADDLVAAAQATRTLRGPTLPSATVVSCR